MTDRLLAGLAVFLALNSPLWSLPDEATNEVAEAPEALFDQKIGDVGVILEADGTWTTRLAGGWGLGFSPQGTLSGLGYPGFEKGGVFTQEPDFSLTLRLLERYYLEVVYGGTLSDRSFLVGYNGRPGELIQSAKVGNASFSVPGRAGETLPEGRRGAPAAALETTVGPVSLEFLGRYEDGARETRTFQGFRDTSTALVTLDRWIRGRFFRLPPRDQPYTGVRVLVADPAGAFGGPATRFRPVQGTEAAIDSEAGHIRLEKPAERTYLVTWEGAATWDNAPTARLGLQAHLHQDDQLTDGPWFVLVQPGNPTPFEVRNSYPVAKDTSGPISLVNRDTGLPVDGYTIGQSASRDWFEVSGEAEAPFWAAAPGLYPSSNAGSPPVAASSLPWAFRLPSPVTTGSFNLGTDIIASSLVVVRNGLPTTAFRFNAQAGTLALDTPVFESDTIKISYQRTKSGSKASDLVLWQGGRWDLADRQNAEWVLQGRWNMDKSAFTTEDLQSPGRVSATLGYEGDSGPWSWSASASAGALMTDSTGHRRLYGQTEGGAQAILDGDSLRPSAAPGDLGGVLMSRGNRAPTFFRNYWSSDPLTGLAQVSAWGTPGIERSPWEENGWVGPYLVRGDGRRSERLVVVEADLEPGQWAGAQVFVDKGKPRDLGSTSAISVPVRLPAGLGTTRAFFQAGTLSEDFDGTGSVRKVEYRAYPSLAFLDGSSSTRLYFPIPEDSVWGNDTGDGAAGVDGQLISRELSLDRTSSEWQTINLPLSDPERKVLERTTGWRIVLIQETSAASQTLLTGPVVFQGSTWSVQPDPDANPGSSVNPVERADPSRKEGRQLQIDWHGRPQWTIEGRHSPVRPLSYRAVEFQYQLVTAADAVTLEFALTDAQGRGVVVTWAPTITAGWAKARLDWGTREFLVDGVRTGTVRVQSGADAWDRLALSVGGTSEQGELRVSEIEAVDPVWEPVATSRLASRWKQPAPWPSSAFPIFSGLDWGIASRQSGLTQQDAAWRGQTTLSGAVGPIQATGEASFFRTAAMLESRGAYEATLPVGWAEGPRVEWTDRFSDAGLRSERLVLRLPWLGVFQADAAATGPPASLDQDYRLGWSLVKDPKPTWEAGLNGSWSQTSPWSRPLGDFGSQWTQSWSWLKPVEGIAPFYLLRAGGESKVHVGSWSFEVLGNNAASQSQGSESPWTAFGDWEIKTPYKSADGWTLSPSIGKKLETVWSGMAALQPRQTAVLALHRLWTPAGSLGSVPFGERAITGAPWGTSREGLRSGRVESTAGLDWERSAVSDWTDLVVPAAAGLQWNGARGQEEEALYQSQKVAGRVQARSLNLLGSMGSLPIFDWYRTDLWAWSVSGSWGTGSRAQDRASDAAGTVRSELVLTPEESVALPAAYQTRWGNGASTSVSVKPTWALRRPADLPFELPRWLSPKAFRREWVQEVAMALDLGWQPEPSPLVRDLQISWKGTFQLSQKSALSLTTRWGQQWQRDLTVVGLEASLDLVLNF